MKKQLRLSLVSAAVLLAVSTASFSASNYKGEQYKGEVPAPCPAPFMIKDGFYLGLQGGYDSYRVRENVNVIGIDDIISANPTRNSTGWVGGILGGYGQYFNDLYYLGAEIFVNGSGASSSYNNTVTGVDGISDVYASKVTVGTSYGISLLPGVKLNEASLLYVRLGWNRASIKGQESFVDDGVLVATGSNTNWSNGFNYGAGIEAAFYQNWSARLEYTHTNYSSFTNSVSNTNFSPSDNQVMAAVIYHFA